MNYVKSIKINSGWAIQNLAWVISAHAALPSGRLFIACLNLLFLNLHEWQRGHGLLSVRHAKAWFLTWDNFKGYVLTKSNLTLLWWWLAAWKPLKLGSHVSWRGLCVLFRICYFRYWKVVAVPRAFYLSCHRVQRWTWKLNRIGWISA